MRRMAFAFAVGLVLAATPARAQVPAPPPELSPVFEVIAPTVSPVCGNALLVAVLAPGLVGGPTGGAVPIDGLVTALGPVFTLCGAVPAPPARLSCDADRSVNETANAAAAAVAGTPLPVGVNPFGAIVEQLVVVQDKLPAPASSAGVAEQVVATLNCKAASTVKTPEEIPPAAGTDEPADEEAREDEFALGDDFALAPLLDGALAPDITSPGVTEPDGQALDVRPVGELGSSGFAYPIVFGFPLVLLVVGGYLGRSLTRPVVPPGS